MKPKYKLLIVCALFVLVLMFIFWVKKELKIDSCLDLGGRWNFQAEQCEFSEKSAAPEAEASS